MTKQMKFRPRIRRIVGVALSALACGSMAATPAYANVEGELNSFFNEMGVAGNVTGPSAYQGQAAGYYTGGGIWSRFPQKSVSPVNIQLPSAKAGCGGIDLFTGSFSFINSDEIVSMMKAVANNALGFAFQLAIKSISPQISNVIEEMSQKAQQLNQFNMNSCEIAQGLVGGLWGKNQGRDSEVCKAIANSQGWATDWARSRQNCNAGGERESTIAKNTDATIPAKSYNYTWDMLKQNYPSMDKEFREYLMSLVGTVIYIRPATDADSATYSFKGVGDKALLTALIDGTGSTTTQMLNCPDDDCLTPTMKNLNVSTTIALKTRVYNMLVTIHGKIRTDSALDGNEIGLLGATSLPLYKIMTVSAASEFGGMSDSDLQMLAEVVAVDMVETIADVFYGYVRAGQGTFHNADEETLGQWRDQISSVRDALKGYGENTSQRMARTQVFLDRTVFLERTIRNRLSPQMSAALSFSTAMSKQGVQ
ncbi:conjugal transfer protein TraH [Croceicoccus mobilis]|uniref:Conjugal transfer pilus assembly protein TraH n=1 Tax=Croceicoccus mobilis TaxID=1703339 RepID=A0A916Z9B0_9SPHN|nr:conjugal transfer protein TraH [Croceicoccus mobilis]GGD82092.1 conjugal transfer pilus assembly protein TraH [Croceicoccus mobilis]